jgi:hypothetical protein
MKKINLFLTLIAVVMLVGLTNCKKDKENTSITKYVGTVNGSFVAQDAGIKVSKDLAPTDLTTRAWSMYAKNSPFYNNQQFALINGLEFVTGSAAQQWWAISSNNPLTLTADQTYSSLIPTESVRLVMEGFGSDKTRAAYLGIIDFDPTQAEFPLTVTSKSLGDILIVNADGLTSQSGGITVTVSYNVYPVDMAATKSKSQLSTTSITGVSGVLDFIDIQYDQQPSPTYSKSDFSVGAGDYVVFSDIASKIKGDITIKITQNGNTITLTQPAAALGQGMKITLSVSKVDGVSHTLGVTDQDIVVNSVPISVSGLNTGNNGGGGQNPPITSNIILNANMSGSIGNGSVWKIYDGLANLPEIASPSLQIFLAVNPPYFMTDIPSDLAHAYVYNTGGPYGIQANNGEVTDMGTGNQMNSNQAPPTTGFSFNTPLIEGNTYVVRFRKVIDYQTSLPLPSSPSDYLYGIFYVTGYQSDGVTITYQGPFDPTQQ